MVIEHTPSGPNVVRAHADELLELYHETYPNDENVDEAALLIFGFYASLTIVDAVVRNDDDACIVAISCTRRRMRVLPYLEEQQSRVAV